MSREICAALGAWFSERIPELPAFISEDANTENVYPCLIVSELTRPEPRALGCGRESFYEYDEGGRAIHKSTLFIEELTLSLLVKALATEQSTAEQERDRLLRLVRETLDEARAAQEPIELIDQQSEESFRVRNLTRLGQTIGQNDTEHEPALAQGSLSVGLSMYCTVTRTIDYQFEEINLISEG